MNKISVARVLLALPISKVFDYEIPEGCSVIKGSIVEVSFNKKLTLGVVIDFFEVAKENLCYQINSLLRIFERSLKQDEIDFIFKASSYNVSHAGNILKMFLISRNNLICDIEKFIVNKEVKNNGKAIALSDEQKKVAEEISENSCDKFSVNVVYGATGSGKTEVYLKIARDVIAKNGQVMILLPEVLLATQLGDRFRDTMSDYKIAQWHSSITPKKKKSIWHNLIDGDLDIVVGARSALFLPFKNLRLIIIDEEQDNSFKQDERVIYNARDMAVLRAHILSIPIILSTATPSLETYYNVKKDRYHVYTLPNRYTGVSLPEVQTINMKSNKDHLSQSISFALKDEIIRCLDNKKVAMLFLNRRGYVPITLCKSCGEKFSCPNCQFWLVQHKRLNAMLCHYCGYNKTQIIECSKCGAEKSLLTLGAGIEKLEEEIQRLFPTANIININSDTVNSYSKAKKVIKEIEDLKYDIIIGTQMLAKGLNLPNLHLVAVVDADSSFSNCDVRSMEKAFHLLYQVAGRAGREYEKGKVLLQTYFPNNILFNYIKNWDYDSFVEFELQNRLNAMMPPVSRIVMIKASSEDEHRVKAFMDSLVGNFLDLKDVDILGPSPAPIYKIKNKFRYRIIIRANRKTDIQKQLHNVLEKVKIPHKVIIKVDVDPYNFM